MPIQPILKMGDARLLRMSEPVQAFDTPELHALLQDLRDTMKAANGAGIAAPQIGVNLQVVIFGSGQINPRYPQYEPIPPTVLINPVITVLDATEDEIRETYYRDLDEIFPGFSSTVRECLITKWHEGQTFNFPGRGKLQPNLV